MKNVVFFVLALFLMLTSQLIAQTVDPITVIVDGDYVYLRTSFNDSQDLLQKLEVFSEPELGDNNPFNFSNTWLIPKNMDYSDATNDHVIHLNDDDACPRRYNNATIGANHGLDYVIKVDFVENHGFHENDDIGKELIDEDNNERKFYVLQVVDANTVYVLSENRYEYFRPLNDIWSFETQIISNQLITSSGGEFTLASQGNIQLEPVIKYYEDEEENKMKMLYVDDVKITSDGIYYGEEVIIEEFYYISNPALTLKNIRDPLDPDKTLFNTGAAQIEIENEFSFDKWGGCTIISRTKNLTDIK
ncbi:MAG: hypothetical protein KAS62_12605, partial [Candidatus Delongbacteria bacterium]|nr:hypothetical protein [Candidatus Delongbacteria bacterium]